MTPGYIEMEWEGDCCEFELVRGWPGEEATRKVIEAALGNAFTRDWTFRERYAINLQTGMSRENGWEYEIQLCDEPGRGRYKVSVLEPPKTKQGVSK